MAEQKPQGEKLLEELDDAQLTDVVGGAGTVADHQPVPVFDPHDPTGAGA